MRLIFKYLLQNLKAKKFRTAIIIVFLILCNFLIIANLGINDYYNVAYKNNVEYENGKVDCVVNPGTLVDKNSIKLPKDKIDNSFDVLFARGKIEKEFNNIKVNIVGADLSALKNDRMIHSVENYGVEENENHTNNDSGEKDKYIIISEFAKDLLGANGGEIIHTEFIGEKRDLQLTNIAQKSGIFAGDNDNNITILMSLSQLQKYYNVGEKVSSIYVSVNKDYKIDTVTQKIKDLNKKEFPQLKVTKTYDEKALSQKKSANTLALMVAMLIMIFISVYLISFITKVIFIERMQVMGTFQSIGATPFKTALIFVGENVCYGLIGWIGGSILSLVFCQKIFEKLNTFQSDVKIHTKMSLLYFAVALIASVVIMLFCSIGSVAKMKKKTVKELLMSSNKTAKNISLTHFVVGILFAIAAFVCYKLNTNYNLLLGVACFILTVVSSIILSVYLVWAITKLYDVTLGKIFKRSFHFGVDNLRNDKMLSGSVTLISINVSMLLCIVMVIMSVKFSMKTMIDNNDFDISCTSLSDNLDDYKDIETLDGVKETYLDYIYPSKVEIKGNKAGATFVGISNEKDFYSFRSKSIKYNRANAKKLVVNTTENEQENVSEKRYVMIDSFLAQKNNLKIGDKIKLINSENNKVLKKDFEIIDFIDSSGFTTARDTVIVDNKYLKENLNAKPYQYLIKIKSDADVDEVARNVSDKLIDTSTVVKTISDVVESNMSGVDALVMILYVIIAISALLVIFGVINNISISFLTRKRELAVLYSTAMSKEQLNIMFYGEIIAMYFIIMLYSIVSAVIYKYIMPKILWSAGLAFKMSFPVNETILIAGILFVILNLLVIIPIVNLKRMNTVEVLKYE